MPQTLHEPKEPRTLPISTLLEKQGIPDTAVVMAGIGEVLMDVFDKDRATMGGAPFNAAFHLNQLLEASELGWIGLVALLCTSFFMSLMYPTNFALGVK